MSIRTKRCLSFFFLNFHGFLLSQHMGDTSDIFVTSLLQSSPMTHLILTKLFPMSSLPLGSSSKTISLCIYLLFVYRCIMNGEIRSPISEILWTRALSIIQGRNNFTEEEIGNLHLNYKSLATPEDILNRAKVILKSYSDQD